LSNTGDVPAPSTSRRVRKTQHERTTESTERLLAAAIELFAAQGYENTTTEQIAERAGYSRAMVNARFGSKEGLLESMLNTEWEGLLLGAVTTDAPGMSRIVGVVDALRLLVEQEAVRLRAFMNVSFEATGPNPEVRPHIQDRLGRIEEAFAEAMTAGMRDGTIREDLDPAFEAREFIHSGIGGTYRWLIDPDFDFSAYLVDWRAAVIRRLAAPAPSATSAQRSRGRPSRGPGPTPR
jgi:AcrR family transcriptional regulator